MTKVTREVVVPSNEPDDFGFDGLWNESDFAPGPVEEVWALIKKDSDNRSSRIARRIKRDLENLDKETLAKIETADPTGRKAIPASILASYRKDVLGFADERVKLSIDACRDIWKRQGRTESALFFYAVFWCCLPPIFSDLYLSNHTQKLRSVEGDSWREALKNLENEWAEQLEEYASNARMEEQTPAIAATPATPSTLDAVAGGIKDETAAAEPDSDQSSDVEPTIAAAAHADLPAVDAFSLPPNMTAAEKDQHALRVADETGFSLNVAAKIIAGHLGEPEATSRRRITRARRARRKQNGQLG